MKNPDRVENKLLEQAGVELMKQNEKPLTKRATRGRAMLYSLPNGESVRIRTTNDHVLVAVADKPSEDAHLNIEGTDWLLVVMPEIERTHGGVLAYLVPAETAVQEVRRTHKEWLDSNPRTRGRNTTWNLWFGDNGLGRANNYATKWSKFLLEGEATTTEFSAESDDSGTFSIKSAVEAARRDIAKTAGVSPDAVKISINFSA